MSWEAIQAQAAVGVVGAMSPLAPSALRHPAAEVSGPSFGQIVSTGLAQVNEQLIASQVDLQRLATGDVDSLHRVMIGLEETRLSFQLLLQVRNRMLEAYQDVMKMQI